MLLFNRSSYFNHRKRSIKNINQYSTLFKFSAKDIIERIQEFDRNFDTVIDLGARTGFFRKLLENNKVTKLIETDIDSSILSYSNHNKIYQIIADDENIPLKGYDLLISNLNMHFINNLPLSLQRIKNGMNQNSLFISSILGGSTLQILKQTFIEYEIRKNKISSHVIPMIKQEDVASLMQKIGFKSQIVDSQIVEIEFENILDLFQYLRGMGESNVMLTMKNYGLSKNSLLDLEQIYRSKCDGNIIAEFEIITITGFM